jgi:glucose/arabinose dehydrogenase
VLPDGRLIVVDMGGWTEKRGSVWLLRREGASYRRTRLIAGLDRPHGAALGPDERLYIGTVGGVLRVALDARLPPVAIIGGDSGIAPLPTDGRHPLVSLVFDRRGDLFLSVGSASDNCDPAGGWPNADAPCPETLGREGRGVIRKYRMAWPDGRVVGWELYAAGLRNSLALAIHPDSGVLVQGENARDAIHLRISSMQNDEEVPPDEINLIVAGGRYGWPYCYGSGTPSPEYPTADCSRYRAPWLLLPAHVAPLGMAYALDPALPAALRSTLIVTYHGYRKHGHRVVAFATDRNGRPQAPSRDVIAGWEAGEGRPLGSPVDVKVGRDGAIYVSEDRNGTVLRLVYEAPASAAQPRDPRAGKPASF